jgi:hypothetical protein
MPVIEITIHKAFGFFSLKVENANQALSQNMLLSPPRLMFKPYFASACRC